MTNREAIEYASKQSFLGLYFKGRADILEELLSRDFWNKNQRMLLEEWLKEAKNEQQRNASI